jgi:hypothetical protein
LIATMCMFWSAKNDSLISSQRYHLDGEDVTQLKLFLNVWDVDEESGPLTFFPAAPTRAILNVAGRQKNVKTGDVTFEDEVVLAGAGGEPPVQVMGVAGSGVLLDTSRCIHYGSRGNRRERLILMLKYVPCNFARESNSSIGATDWLATEQDDALQRLVLGIKR